MTEQATARKGAIDIQKTVAGVLAAVSAAVVGSYLGVAGTLVGAAVASIVGSVGTELYHRWINRGSEQLRRSFVAAPAAVGTPEVPAAADRSPSQLDPPEPSATESSPTEAASPASPVTIRWGRVAAVAAGVFVLAIGTLTAFELITGKSAADAMGNRSPATTTVCSVLCGGNKARPTPTPSVSPSTSPSATSTPSSPAPATSTAPITTTSPVPATTSAGPAATQNPAPTQVVPQNQIVPKSPPVPQNMVDPQS